jgi:hypothetical protein
MKRAGWILLALACWIAPGYASKFPIAEIVTRVVVLRTFESEGATHETRVTVIDLADEPWVRGRPYRGRFRRIEANPQAELDRDAG